MSALVLITRPLPEDGLRALREAHETIVLDRAGLLSEEELIAEARKADALVTLLSDPISARVFSECDKLRVVAQFAVGYDNIDLKAAKRAGVVVTHTPGVLTDATADFTFALLLAVARRICEADAFVRAGRFDRWEAMLMLGTELRRKTLGIYGMGRIGRAVARRALGFGMNVIYHNRSRANPTHERDVGARYVDWDTLLEESDILSLHAPLNDDSRGIVNKEAIARMKPGAILINTARGALVDEGALVEALRSGRLAGAGLDVYQHEPELAAGLAELSNAVLAPHLGSATVETRTEMARMCADSVLAVLRGDDKIPNRLV